MALLRCPSCSEAVRGEAVNIRADTARCAGCGHVFRVSAALPATTAGRVADAGPEALPADVELHYPPEGGFHLVIPPGGLTGRGLGAIFFAFLYNAIVLGVGGGFTYGYLQGEVPVLMVLFFIPFLLAGFYIVLWACRLVWGTDSLWLDHEGFALVRQLFGWRRSHAFALDDVEGFERQVAYTQNNRPVYTCAAKTAHRSCRFGHRLSDGAQEWLVNELTRVLEQLRAGHGH